jgi:hypothetical protein
VPSTDGRPAAEIARRSVLDQNIPKNARQLKAAQFQNM